jgi:cytochrome c
MSKKQWLRIVVVAGVIVIALIVFRLHAAGQGDAPGNVASGRHLSEAWCTECHSVEQATVRTGEIAPDFVAIAQRPGTTVLSLRAFLQSNHKTMPNFIIERRVADDIIAYILTLRRP